jgi:uncharacterized membrane protein
MTLDTVLLVLGIIAAVGIVGWLVYLIFFKDYK